LSLDDESSFLVTLVLKRKSKPGRMDPIVSILFPGTALWCRCIPKEGCISAERLALGRYVPIQKGAEFVMDNNWGTFERTIAARRLDGFPSSFNQLSAEYTSLFLL